MLLLLALACTDQSVDSAPPPDWDADGYIDAAAGGDDCNDRQPNVYPGAPTTCGDGIDNDCDGDSVEDYAFYADKDGDRYGDATDSLRGCDAPAGYVEQVGDCDDGDPERNPETIWYADEDGDGFGLESAFTLACEQPTSSDILVAGDCDDADAHVFPGAPAVCDDGVVQDCNATDEIETCGAAVSVSLPVGIIALYGTTTDEQLGADVAFVGDLDRDGFDDFVVGAPRYEHSRAYVFHGHETGLLEPEQADAMIDEPNYNDAAVGRRVAGVGDLDRDGRVEFAVAETGFGLDMVEVAGVALYEGAVTGSLDMVDAPIRLLPRDIRDLTGWALDGGSDLSGDHVADLIIGTPYRNDEGGAGRVYVVFGPLSSGQLQLHPSYDADADLRGENADDQAGFSAAILSDFNGDGDADVLVGAPGSDRAGNDAGAAYVLFGPVSGVVSLADADLIATGQSAEDHAGWAVAAVGDMDNDGGDDLVIGAPDRDADGVDAGTVYLVSNGRSGEVRLRDADERWTGEGSGALAGYALDGAGDINGDDRADLLVGSPGLNREGGLTGAAYLLYGGAVGGRLADAPWRLMGEGAYDTAGISVDGGGDFDADGVPDLLVGAPGNDRNGLSTGAAYLILGSTF